ncbi:PREDICTED: uncharacterized protein LOC104803633 [Tarenaya hassleriana]|uniref:uncharacterized protein LOC104803633 n=1 Tax=Tarenaya hassleriana TaxID=28532 RepID=UPI00053C6300|nr:PREDICTED: uncharacterized protein LOC104803633 [Tarenaya hassleriana]
MDSCMRTYIRHSHVRKKTNNCLQCQLYKHLSLLLPLHFIPTFRVLFGERERERVMADSESFFCSYEADVDSDCEGSSSRSGSCFEAEEEIDNGGNGVGLVSEEKRKEAKKNTLEKKKSQVLLEGYVEAVNVDGDHDDLKRTKSLTDDDLEELKGCVDLGFGFSYEEIPELCNTLPALELCYSMSQKFLDHDQNTTTTSPEKKTPVPESSVSPIASWKISSPGDNPDDVKARLKYWAQAVACTVRLCS